MKNKLRLQVSALLEDRGIFPINNFIAQGKEIAYRRAISDVLEIIDDMEDAEEVETKDGLEETAYGIVMALRDFTNGVSRAISELTEEERQNIVNLLGGTDHEFE